MAPLRRISVWIPKLCPLNYLTDTCMRDDNAANTARNEEDPAATFLTFVIKVGSYRKPVSQRYVDANWIRILKAVGET